jgi:ribosomal protein S19
MGTSVIYTKNRQISLKDLNKKFLIYNGKDFQKLVISQSMIGHNFGEFTSTRKVVPFNIKKK